MKKRIPFLALVLVLILALALPALAEPTECTHENKNPVARQEPNCTERGWEAHMLCADCGMPFDLAGNPLDDIPYIECNQDHDYDTTQWGYADDYGHAHTCTRNPEHHDEIQFHYPEDPEVYPQICAECGYVIQEAPLDTPVTLTLPFLLTVEKTGELDPGPETFRFIPGEFGAPVELTVTKDSVETNGEKTYEGSFVFTLPEYQLRNLEEGFFFYQVKSDAEGWIYDGTTYYVMPRFVDNTANAEWQILPLNEEGFPDYNSPLNQMVFTNFYNAQKPTKPETEPTTEPTTAPTTEATTPSTTEEIVIPPTGDGGQPLLWTALILVSSAAGICTVLLGRKRSIHMR